MARFVARPGFTVFPWQQQQVRQVGKAADASANASREVVFDLKMKDK